MNPRTLSATALALICVLALTACIPVPIPFAETKPSSTPPAAVVDFAAATESADDTIRRYWSAVEETYTSAGERLEALELVTTETTLRDEESVAKMLAASEVTLIPEYRLGDTQFEQLYYEKGELFLVVSTCVDYSLARIVDSAGKQKQLRPDAPRVVASVTIRIDEPDTFTGLRIAGWAEAQGPGSGC